MLENEMPKWSEYNCKHLDTTMTYEVTIEDVVYKVFESVAHTNENLNSWTVKRQGVHGEFYSIEESEADWVVSTMHAAEARFDAFEEPPF